MRGTIPWPVFAQGEAPRDELVRRFRAAGNGCLFGTYTFWEGVDVAGPSLSCVVIDRLPFDPPDEPVVRARAEAARLRGEDRFNDYQLPLAVIRLRQGFGRLVRRRSDRGVVAILDRRIKTKKYGEVFLKSLPPAPVTTDIAEVRRWCRKRLNTA
jgi:ATP-dependent DNA helicase DinG